jgi:alcohol dehydrogenase
MDIDRRAVPELFERVADAMGEPDDGSGDGSRAVRGVREMLRRIDLPTLRDCGVSPDDFPALAQDALDDFFITLAPHPWTVEDAIACYEAAWAIERR